MGIFTGIILHALGGFASASFYNPLKFIKQWNWETSWLVFSVAAWVIFPLLSGLITVPNLYEVLFSVDSNTKAYTFVFGMLWGIGGLTFGLTIRYLGIGLGMTTVLGFTAAYGTFIPPIHEGRFGELIDSQAGLIIMSGVFVCSIGIILTVRAGILKEFEVNDNNRLDTIKDFDLYRGLSIAIVSGIMSSCFSFGLYSGKPIAEIALQNGTQHIFQNNAILIWILWGGFMTNLIGILVLSFKNKTFDDFTKNYNPNTSKNYTLAFLGGIIWYMQFFLYGMGATFLGKNYEFASWSLHISFIILFSSFWGLYFNEWQGASKKTMRTLFTGLLAIILSTLIIGIGNSYL